MTGQFWSHPTGQLRCTGIPAPHGFRRQAEFRRRDRTRHRRGRHAGKLGRSSWASLRPSLRADSRRSVAANVPVTNCRLGVFQGRLLPAIERKYGNLAGASAGREVMISLGSKREGHRRSGSIIASLGIGAGGNTPTFVRTAADAALSACIPDYGLLRSMLVELKRGHPEGLSLTPGV